MVRLLQVLHDDILLEHHGLRAILDLISSYQEIDPWDQNHLTDRGRELLSDSWTMNSLPVRKILSFGKHIDRGTRSSQYLGKRLTFYQSPPIRHF